MALTPKQQRFVTEYGLDLNATQAAIRAGYSPKTAQQQGSRLLRNAVVQAAVTAQQTEQLAAVEVRSAEVLRELMAIAHTDLRTLAEQSGVSARWADKIKALELLMKHLGLAEATQAPGNSRTANTPKTHRWASTADTTHRRNPWLL